MSRKKNGKKCAPKFNTIPYKKVWGKNYCPFPFVSQTFYDEHASLLQFEQLNKCHLIEP